MDETDDVIYAFFTFLTCMFFSLCSVCHSLQKKKQKLKTNDSQQMLTQIWILEISAL